MRIYAGAILIGCALFAPVAQAQPTNTTSESIANIATYNTTDVTQQVSTFQVELRARMQGGSYLFDQTYNAAITDPSVQAGITQAMSVLTNAGALSFTGPTQLSSTTSTSSATSTVQTQKLGTTAVSTTTYVGPVTIDIGNFGTCTGYTLTGPLNRPVFTGCTGGTASPFSVIPGGEDVDTLLIVPETITQTVTTTNTTLTSQVYEIDGFSSAFSPCDVNQDGKTNVADVHSIINEGLGGASPANDLTGDDAVNVVDIQIVMNAVLNLGCSASTDKPAGALHPTITAVVSAASLHPGPIAPGEVVALIGSGFGSGGIEVLFDGTPAPLTYVSPTYIKCIVPYEVRGKRHPEIQVRYQELASNMFPLDTAATNPAIFTVDGSGSGAAAALNQDQSANSAANPAARGTTVVLFVTGEGQTSPPGMTGKLTTASDRTPQPVLPIAVLIGGQPAAVVFYGEAPGVISGVMQLNVQIPSSVPLGDLTVSVSVGGNSSQSGVTVSVRE